MALREILQRYNDPALLHGPSDPGAEAIARAHLDEVLGQLPRRPAFPNAAELAGVRDDELFEPFLLQRPVIVDDLAGYFRDAGAATVEVSVEVFDTGSNVLLIGDSSEASSPVLWSPFSRHAVVDFHTHPTHPSEHLRMREPTLEDIDASRTARGMFLFGSVDGVTHIPKGQGNQTARNLWNSYIIETRDLNEQSFQEYGADKVYSDFIRDVIKPVYMDWSKFTPGMTLSEVADVFRAHMPPD